MQVTSFPTTLQLRCKTTELPCSDQLGGESGWWWLTGVQSPRPPTRSPPTRVSIPVITLKIDLSYKPILRLLINLHLKALAMEEPDARSPAQAPGELNTKQIKVLLCSHSSLLTTPTEPSCAKACLLLKIGGFLGPYKAQRVHSFTD